MDIGSKWNVTAETASVRDTPLLFRGKFINTGYRLPHQPWLYYMNSLFQSHNETGNVWTHLVTSIFFTYQTINLGKELDFMDDSLAWPVLLLLCSIVSYSLFSSMAHLFHSKSALVHFTCFQIDYIGVSMNACCSGWAYYMLSGTSAFYDMVPPNVFLCLNAVFSMLICFCCGGSRLKLDDPNGTHRIAWLIGSNGVATAWASSAVFYRVFSCYVLDSKCSTQDVQLHWQCIVLFLLSAILFVGDFPERIFPGTFDYLGQGHQLFHICMSLTSYAQVKLALSELHKRPSELIGRLSPYSRDAIGSAVIVLFMDILFVVVTHSHRVESAKIYDHWKLYTPNERVQRRIYKLNKQE